MQEESKKEVEEQTSSGVFQSPVGDDWSPKLLPSTKKRRSPVPQKETKKTTSTSLQVKKITESATLPKRATDGSAGFDLFCCEDVLIPPSTLATIPLQIAIKFPSGHYGQIAPRSSLAKQLSVEGGIIDADYRGPLFVMLRNFSDAPVTLLAKSRIAQLILVKISTPDVEEVTELDVTERGEGGFGSTGR